MMKRTASILVSVFLISGFFFMVSMKPAHAYIELSSVSFVLQMLVAGAFGVLFTLKLYWRNLTGNISRMIAVIRRTKSNSD